MMHVLLAAALLAAAGQAPQAAGITPPRLVTGAAPPMPIMVLAGGQVFLELTIDADGHVAGVTTLRTTPPLTALVSAATRSWHFDPSVSTIETVTDTIRFWLKTGRLGKVFVGAIFRPPSLAGATLGTAPADAQAADSETPYPIVVKTPGFPPAAFGAGIVLVELQVEADGSVSDACVLESAPPFDEVAIDAARAFHFRPAKIGGVPVRAYAYILFGFPVPITGEEAR
jgi:TonB family protein